MIRLRWFTLGVLLAVSIGIAAVAAVLTRSSGFSARASPTALERWLARQVRSAALPQQFRALQNSAPNTPENLSEARAHWADHCAVCHANDGSGDTEMGKHMYPPAPDMRQQPTQNLTDGELFSIIQNGVRMTGMPAWGGSADDEAASWKLVRFIRHLPALTAEERTEMEKLNPKGPEDRAEEEEEEKFLKGEDADEPAVHHHHH